jgi:hypothetical protein
VATSALTAATALTPGSGSDSAQVTGGARDEIVRPQSGGWTVAWDANRVEPATRRAFDKVIAGNAKALCELLRQTSGHALPES